jgi:hypothetical protein
MSIELESVKIINSLKQGVEAITGETRANLTEAVKDLIDGYGQGGGGDGFSPIAKVEETESGVLITITDKNDTTTATVKNGKDGEKGDKGDKGEQGEQGIQGIQGERGLQGEKGEKGDSYILTEEDKTEIAGLVDVEKIPDYITTEAERVAKNIQATRTAKSLIFPVMSDMHLFDGNSTHDNSLISAQCAGMGIKELEKRIHLDFIGYLGDYTWGADNYTVEQVAKDITTVKENIGTSATEIWCVGNHDFNYGANRDRLLTLDELYGYIGANSSGKKPYESIERCYGYIDFENQKIRVIYLNTCDASDWATTEGTKARSEWISPTQMQWFVDTALDFTNKESIAEWGIVIVSHHPLHYGFVCYSQVMEILEGYKNGTAGTVINTIDGVNNTISYDFTNSTERAEIICNIHGHTHNCSASQISSTSWTDSNDVEPWLWRISIPQICGSRYNSGYENFKTNESAAQRYGEFDENGNPVYWYKETGTAKATSFCVVNIDRKNKKIYSYIFGAGKNRGFDYENGWEIDMETNEPIIPEPSEPTNLLRLATSELGGTEIYGGDYNEDGTADGYQINTRYSSSQGVITYNGMCLSGYINLVTDGGTFNIKNITLNGTSTTFLVLYKKDGTASAQASTNYNGNDTDGYTITIPSGQDWGAFRLCVGAITDESIITVNEPIE